MTGKPRSRSDGMGGGNPPTLLCLYPSQCKFSLFMGEGAVGGSFRSY